MLKISYTTKFKKELKQQIKRGNDSKIFFDVSYKLANEEKLDAKYRNHKLTGNFKDRWECHIKPDWLVVYIKTKSEIIFERTGSHSDLFK